MVRSIRSGMQSWEKAPEAISAGAFSWLFAEKRGTEFSVRSQGGYC